MRLAVLDPSFDREARGRRFLGRAVAALILAGALAACGIGAGSPTPEPTPTAVASVIETAGPTVSQVFPVRLTDDEGTAVEIAAEPQRIVSLTPGSTEIAFALGAGDRIVATDSASDYPAEAVPLPDVADFGAADLEQIVGLDADLVLAGGNGYTPPDSIDRLRSLGIPVVVLYAETVDGVIADVELVAAAIGNAEAGAALAATMTAEIDGLAAAVAGGSTPRTFYEIDGTREIYGPAEGSYLAEVVTLAGGDPITSGSASFEIALEDLIAADPEVIVLGDAAFGTTAETVAARPGWAVITAVANGAIRVADDKLITRPGPRLALGLRSLILAIHPGAVLP